MSMGWILLMKTEHTQFDLEPSLADTSDELQYHDICKGVCLNIMPQGPQQDLLGVSNSLEL
jgi:hypothetical protein